MFPGGAMRTRKPKPQPAAQAPPLPVYENPVPFDDMVRRLLKAKPQPRVPKKAK